MCIQIYIYIYIYIYISIYTYIYIYPYIYIYAERRSGLTAQPRIVATPTCRKQKNTGTHVACCQDPTMGM